MKPSYLFSKPNIRKVSLLLVNIYILDPPFNIKHKNLYQEIFPTKGFS